MSSIFDNEKNKAKCQKFTPANMVTEMLNMAGYTHNLVGKRILENSFGCGNILKEIVRRYIEDCISRQIPARKISECLQRDIYGIELDELLYRECIISLNTIAKKYGISDVKWSLFNTNALTWDIEIAFDFIIGNPPYITYKDIDNDSKKWIKHNYSTCKTGKFDYCYAFIESAIMRLSEHGRLVQLIPGNIYKNVFADRLRDLLKPHLEIVWEYPAQKMFGDTLTSSSIFLYNNACNSDDIQYKNVTANKTSIIPRSSLSGKWIFAGGPLLPQNTEKFGDHFHASIAVATLLNKAFIVSEEEVGDIEDEVLRPAASPKSLRYGKNEYIIFPYSYNDNRLVHLSNEEFRDRFPHAFSHLKHFEDALNERSKDQNAKWFEYGRTQALVHLNQEKLLISTVVTNAVDVYTLNQETIPYCGIYITCKGNRYNLEDARKILQSQKFKNYVQGLGVSISGKSKRITCKDVNAFAFCEEDIHGTAALHD